jgi:hypothetical protein
MDRSTSKRLMASSAHRDCAEGHIAKGKTQARLETARLGCGADSVCGRGQPVCDRAGGDLRNGINGYMQFIGAPFGDIKASGIGPEFAPGTIASYLQQKPIYVVA